MITSKQRAILRKHANGLETIFQIGKSGISEQTVTEITAAIKVREMVKVKVHETALITAREAAQTLAEQIECDIVQTIGTRFVLYKRNKKNPIYEIK